MILTKTNAIFKAIVLYVLCLSCDISWSSKMSEDDLFPNIALRKITLGTSLKEPNLEQDALCLFREQARREGKIIGQRPEFSWPIYEDDLTASRAFSYKYLQPLKDAEAFIDFAQSFTDKKSGHQKIKNAIKKMKEDSSSHYINYQWKEAAYIWHKILNSPHYKLYSDDKEEIILADQKRALFYFSSGEMNLAALKLGKKLIKEEKEDNADLKNILKAYNHLSILQSQQEDHLDFILSVCTKFHSKEYKTTNDLSRLEETLTKIRAVHPQYWEDTVMSHPYWHNILNYLKMDPDQVCILNGYEPIVPLMLLNRDFFTHITGFEAKDILKCGVKNKPTLSSYSALIFKGYKRKNFPKDTREVSSFFWYSLIGKVVDLPQDYWPYIKKSQITEVSFTHNKITSNKITSTFAQKLGGCLQKTKVNRVFLTVNKLDDKGIVCLIKSLEGTCVKTLRISTDRKITGEKFQERVGIFTKTNIGTFDLSYNNFNSNYLYKLGKIFINSHVHTLNLIGCDLNFTGAYDLIKGLQGTPIYTLNLSQNNIEDNDLNNDLNDLALALKDTNIRAVDFSNNKFSLKGIHEFCDFFITNIAGYKSYWFDFSFGKMNEENLIQLEKDLPNINSDRQDSKNNITNNDIDLIRLFLFDRDIF